MSMLAEASLHPDTYRGEGLGGADNARGRERDDQARSFVCSFVGR